MTTLAGKTITWDVEVSDTIDNVKKNNFEDGNVATGGVRRLWRQLGRCASTA